MVNEQMIKLKPEERHFSARQEMLLHLEIMFLNNKAPDLCNTLETSFSGIPFHGGHGGGGYIGETARLHYPLFFRSVDVHRCTPF